MKFHFKNIGPVTEAELELGDLTIVAGRNNTGKTYLVYTLYGFLSTWRSGRWLPDPQSISNPSVPPPPVDRLWNLSQSLLSEGSVTISWKEAAALRKGALNTMARHYSLMGIERVFNASKQEMQGSSLKVIPSKVNDTSPLSKSVTTEVEANRRKQFDLLYDEDSISVTLPEDAVLGDVRRSSRFVRAQAIELLTDVLLPELPKPVILSAERFGISLFYKELDFSKSALVEALQSLDTKRGRDREAPYVMVNRFANRYAMPVRDNINYTRNLAEIANDVSELVDAQLHGEVESLMGGTYGVGPADDIRFRNSERPRPFDIPLHLASSSVRGLSDLYFYLHHRASKNDLLIIDEPESHLDTANQIEMARALPRCVRAGIKVLVTTHSDFLIKEFNNLIMVDSLRRQGRDGVVEKLGYDPNDGLSKDAIAAYTAQDDGLTRCKIDEHGLVMPVFDDTINRINHVSNSLAAFLDPLDES